MVTWRLLFGGSSDMSELMLVTILTAGSIIGMSTVLANTMRDRTSMIAFFVIAALCGVSLTTV